MAWKTITLHGWRLTFERDSKWHILHKEVYGFCSIDKVEVEGESIYYQETDFTSVDMGKMVSKYPAKTFGIKRCKSRGVYTLKINVREFDPKKIQLHYADVVIKIGDEEIVTENKIIEHITYNGRRCQLQRVGNDGYDKEFETTIWHKSPFIYNSCFEFSEGLAAVKLNDCWKYINIYGRIAIPGVWRFAESFHDGLAVVEDARLKRGIINKIGKLVIACEYEELHPFVEGLAYCTEGDGETFGFIDRKGNKVIPCIHRWFSTYWGESKRHDFSCGVALVRNEQYQFGYIDKEGKTIIPSIYTWVEPFSEGLGAVRKDKLAGFIDATGTPVIQIKYSAVKSFSNGLAPVKKAAKWGYIDKDNNLVIPYKYDNAYGFCDDGLAIIKINGKEGFIDMSGEMILPPKYSEVRPFSEGLAAVRRGKKYGYINKEGDLIVPYIYDWCSEFENGVAIVEIAGKYGCINKGGSIVIPIIYDSVSGPCGNLFAVKLYEKSGFIDMNGNIQIGDDHVYKTLSKKYDQVFIDNGDVKTYSFVLDGKYGLADADGNELIPPRYDWMGDSFVEDMLVVEIRGEGIGFINKQGEEVVAPQYQEVSDFNQGRASVRLNCKWGTIDKHGAFVACEENAQNW